MHSMFTVCPKCTLTLVVTADDLRTGQGYVRCGRCLNVFNALLALTEEPERDTEDAASYSQADPASTSQVTRALAGTTPSEPQVDPPPLNALQSQRIQLATERSSDGAIENESTAAEGTGTFETILLEGDAITQTEEFAPQETVDHEIAALAERLASEQPDEPIPATQDGVGQPSPAPLEAEAEAGEPLLADDEASSVEVVELATPPPSHLRQWTIGGAVLLLLLLAQAINHWRDALALHRSLSGPLTRLYASLGIALDPHWDLSAYDIRQQGAATDPVDTHVIHVRLSVANRALRAQPVPLVRLTLLDRYGKRLAARDLSPSDYWPQGKAPPRFLAHDERIDSEIQVRDPPGADSASFEIDVCLANTHGLIHCAGDAPAPGVT
jgi:predicted Zn finger-like uncharacterized protein